MRQLLRIFFASPHARPWMVLVAFLAATLVEGAGFATLLPLVGLAGEREPASPLHAAVRGALETVGVPIELGPLLALVVAILVLRSLLRLQAMRYVGYAMADVVTGLRREVIEGLLRVRWPFMTGQPLGRVANVAASESMKAARCYTLVAEFLANAIQTLVFTLLSFAVSWRIALGAILIGGAVAGGLHFLVRMSRRAGHKHTRRVRNFLVFLSDTLANLKPVKAMAKEEAFERLLLRRIEGVREALRRQVLSREALNNLQDIVVAVLLGAGFFLAYAVWRVHIAELLVIGILLARAAASLGKLQKSYQAAVEHEASYLHTTELIEEAVAAAEPNPGRREPRFEQAIEVEGVSVAYGDREVLRGLSLTVPARGLTVLTGPSGAGKTTLVDLILGLVRPSGGEVRIDGVPLPTIDLRRWRALVGYVPQETVLFHDTIRANLTLGDDRVDDAAIEAALVTAEAWAFVATLPEGLDTVVGERGARLSGGQRQRIALARALLGSPRLLILDEVTSALDPVTAFDITQNVRRLAERTTVLAVTHRSEFLDIADRIYRIEDGVARPEAPSGAGDRAAPVAHPA